MAKIVVVVEIFVALSEGKDTLFELALVGVDNFVLIAVVVEEFGGTGKEVKLSVDFSQEKNPSIGADVPAFEIGLNFSSLAA